MSETSDEQLWADIVTPALGALADLRQAGDALIARVPDVDFGGLLADNLSELIGEICSELEGARHGVEHDRPRARGHAQGGGAGEFGRQVMSVEKLTGDMMIAIHEAREAAAKVNGDFAAKIKAAMRATKDHWMVTDNDKQFRSAIGGLLLHYPPESDEHKRLQHEMKILRQFGAFLHAAQAGISAQLPEDFGKDDETLKPIGLIGMWRALA